MKKEEVLNCIIKILKDFNAVDSYLTDVEIAGIKLNELELLEYELAFDPVIKRELLLEKMLADLTSLNGGIKPTISPCDYTLFDEDITLDEFADRVAFYS